MSDLAFALLLTLGGAVLAGHCLRMTWRAARTGIAKAQYPDCRRSTRPGAFWIIPVANALAALLGATFLVIGFLLLVLIFGASR
jgi:hypothetical protein